MVSSTRRTIAGILVIFCAAVFARAQAVQPKEPGATITGKITLKGKGTPGIFVALRVNDSSHTRQLTRFRGVSDNEGKYRIENVTPGSYFVVPVAPAYVWDEGDLGKTLNVNKGETIENVDFPLALGGAITGRVDVEGRPLIEEVVSLVPERGNTRARWRPLSTRTDDRGIYRIFGIPPGRYRVAAGNDSTGSRYQRISYQKTFYPGVTDIRQGTVVEVTEGSEVINIDITLSSTLSKYTASGRLVDGQTDEPIPNVTYYVTHYIEHGWTSSSSRVPTNSRGEFLVEDLVPGKYSISAQLGEWRTEEVPFEVVNQDVTGLVLRSERAASVSGVVVLEGTEDKGAREQLIRMSLYAYVANERSKSGGGPGANVTPGPDGSFRLTGLAGGMAMFHASNTTQIKIARVERNGVVQPRGLEIKPGEQITGVRIVVNYANASLRGTVLIENGPVPPGASILVWLRKIGDDPSSPSAGIRTMLQLDARNQFVSENLVPGTYELTAGLNTRTDRRNAVTKTQQIVVTAGAANNVTIALDLKPAAPKP